MKSIPASYCLWCEEKLAAREFWPYCSQFCRATAKKAGK